MSDISNAALHSGPNWIVGGLYSIRGWSHHFNIAKILVIDGGVIHIAIYREEFVGRPDAVDTASLSLGSVEDDVFGVMHIPLEASMFAQHEPELILETVVSEEDLQGYRTYLDYHSDGSQGAFGIPPTRVN
ncbi:hypothetical protein ACPOL_6670 [Acidisarcina polymorpha]|uniref:Uncharacterized protein n=1 Tax=Acidisarcina polymorpha TaxID=2211140 RepID=A0A2Z5G9B6_9BACT|nr:hypothetical protein [Acidisarcina polymorpha]AXC15882.1 hypothetical protein ACPOL_6670 [Acidisarcina polymorpha]